MTPFAHGIEHEELPDPVRNLRRADPEQHSLDRLYKIVPGARGGVSQAGQDFGLANENQIEGAKSGVSQATSAAGYEGRQRRVGA